MDLEDPLAYQRHVATSKALLAKEEWIVGMARGARVLDVGCIDHSVQTALDLGEGWLHRRLRGVAETVVGLDLLADAANELTAEHGFDIRVGDAESFDLGERFDLIVAGDLIEHLSNPGRFLECSAAHLEPEGRVVITTPNPFNIEQFAQALLRGHLFVNPEHALWLDPRTMHQLVSRSPLRLAEFAWIETRFHFHLRGGRLLRRVVNPLTRCAMDRRPILRRDFGVVLVAR